MQTRLGFSTEAYFPVALRGTDGEFSMGQELVRQDTGTVVCLCPTPLPVVTHRAVVEGFEAALVAAGLDGRSIVVHEALPFAGRMAIREYCFSAITLEPRAKDTVAFSLRVVHDYDPVLRSHRGDLAITLFGTRWPSMSALLSPEAGATVSYACASGFPTDAVITRIGQALGQFRAWGALWRRWTTEPVTPATVAQVLGHAALVSNGAEDALTALWTDATRAEAPTRWLLYTTLMRWISFDPDTGCDRIQVDASTLARERCVSQVVQSEALQCLAA